MMVPAWTETSWSGFYKFHWFFNSLTILYKWVHYLDNKTFDIIDARLNHEVCLLINLLNCFLQIHFLLPCLFKSRFNFYFLFSVFLSFFLYYILPSISIPSFSFSSIISPFSSSSLHYLHNYFSTAVFNLHICLHLSCLIFPLFVLLFTISLCLSTHKRTNTHKDLNGLAGRFYKINQPLWYMIMDHCWHDYRRWHNINP